MSIRSVVIIFLMTSFSVEAQQSTPVAGLPLKIYTVNGNDTSKPVIIYYTGDAGFNAFSTTFAKQFNARGYNVLSFNSLKYFWHTKTPEQAAADAIQVIEYAQKTYNRKRFVLIGYSFGADIMPFIFNRLPENLQVNTKNIVLMSPSTHTDFTVHVTELLGRNNKGAGNIPQEINKIKNIPLIIISGEKEEGGLNTNNLTISNFHKIIISGGHHYDGDSSFVVNTIINFLH